MTASCSAWFPKAAPPPQSTDPLVEEVNASWDYCDRRWREGELKTRAERARCIAAGEIPIYRKYQYPHLDLIILLNQKRTQLARREDAGATSESLAAEWRRATDAVAAEESRRQNLLKADLAKPASTQPEWLRKQQPDYRAPAVARARCIWAGANLSCRDD